MKSERIPLGFVQVEKEMLEKRAPENTTETVNPLAFVREAMVIGSGRAIETQEARGQADFVESTTLPTEYNTYDKYDPEGILKSFGVVFLGPVEGDPMFQYVNLPKGWKKKPTSHSMWSELVDDKGRKRASIFYKAAFYDRKASISLCRRYTYDQDYGEAYDVGQLVVYVKDGSSIIFTTTVRDIVYREGGAKDYDVYDKIQKEAYTEAKNWLNVNFPDWEKYDAYWD